MNRRNLGAELRRLRVSAGLKAEDVARHLGCSATRISRLESAHPSAALKADDIRRLGELFQISDGQIAMLLDMLTTSQKIGWWEAYSDVMPSGLKVLVGLESDAQAERAWEPLLVHGLLQTADYARAVLSGWGSHRPGDVADLVEVRERRQESLTRVDDPLELWVVLDEGVVRRPIGGRGTMHAQVTHLIEMSEQANVHLQILPTSKGAHPGLGGSLAILEFAEDQPVVYLETTAGNLYLEKRPDVRTFTGMYQTLGAMALPVDDTTAFLKSVAKEM
ncbi:MULTISPECIES: helix-turn-helix domain-containing protein [Streptomycetaceae]|uniref:helix-turn-helix domain-containing protein n=1 Tax=Streptomycetaceae TaxID=2062 RepID=UPI00300A303D